MAPKRSSRRKAASNLNIRDASPREVPYQSLPGNKNELRAHAEKLLSLSFSETQNLFRRRCDDLVIAIRGAMRGREFSGEVDLLFDLAVLASMLGFDRVPIFAEHHDDESGLQVDVIVVNRARAGPTIQIPLAHYIEGHDRVVGAYANGVEPAAREEICATLELWKRRADEVREADFRGGKTYGISDVALTRWSLYHLRNMFRLFSLPRADGGRLPGPADGVHIVSHDNSANSRPPTCRGIALHPNDVKILRALAEAGTTLTQEQLEKPTGLTAKTIGKRLTNLRDMKLTYRPNNNNRDEAITPAGSAALGTNPAT